MFIERSRVSVEEERALKAVRLGGIAYASRLTLQFSAGKKIMILSHMEGYARFVSELRLAPPELFVN